ncbi:hypothetical protein ACLFKT_39660, partial [Paraburkholderia sp. BR14261]
HRLRGSGRADSQRVDLRAGQRVLARRVHHAIARDRAYVAERHVRGELSGGNQQKVVIGRWLARDITQSMRVVLFDEPTRGIDVGAKFDIYALMGALARDGRALVVVSSDLRELMLICDRIGVMSAGKMTAIYGRDEWSQDKLLAAAFAGLRAEDALVANARDLPEMGDVPPHRETRKPHERNDDPRGSAS